MLRLACIATLVALLAVPAAAQDASLTTSAPSFDATTAPSRSDVSPDDASQTSVVVRRADAPVAPLRTRADVRRALTIDATRALPDAPQVQSDGGWSRKTWYFVAGGAVIAAGGVLAAILLTGDDDGGDATGFPLPPGRPPTE